MNTRASNLINVANSIQNLFKNARNSSTNSALAFTVNQAGSERLTTGALPADDFEPRDDIGPVLIAFNVSELALYGSMTSRLAQLSTTHEWSGSEWRKVSASTRH